MWLVLRPILTKAAAVAVPILTKWFVTQGLPSLRYYHAASTQARAVGGYVGAWVDDDGKHWVVFDRDRSNIVGTFPSMSKASTERALRHVDEQQLVRHDEVALRRATSKLQRVRDKARGALPSRGSGDDAAS